MDREPRRTGGQCEYKEYRGTARIVSVTRLSEPSGALQDRYEVKFVFTPDREIEESFAKIEGREFQLMQKGEAFPDPEFLRKNEILVGKVLKGQLKVIVRGTCTPTIFEFPALDRRDDQGRDDRGESS